MIEFFINRPKFAIVLAIVMTIAGVLTMLSMPVSLYPNVAPPTIQVTAVYPGADHNTIRDTVASVIEQEVNGVEGMIYIDSKSSNDGSYICRITFDIGTDPNAAQTLVQNRVNKAINKLPATVKQLGLTVAKVSPSMLLTINLYSPEKTHDGLFISNYIALNLKDALLRVSGIGELKVIGERNYSVRIWLNNSKMEQLNISHDEISSAIASQNTTISAGKLGESPAPTGQVFQYTIQTKGRLKNIAAFEEVIIKMAPNGSIIRIKDVAEVELGSEKYNAVAKYGEYESPLMIAYLAPGANSLLVAAELKKQMKELEHLFPEDLTYDIPFDSTLFIETSMNEVYKTLLEALVLVSIVTFLFLQNIKATLIPLIAIPVSLVATFLVMKAFNMDINTISMFGLILAIGVVVDAAIVVIENVERLMKEESINAKEATSKAMKEVTAPLIASALVLMAVFVPVSLAPGMVGILYQQFGIAIVASTIISTVIALTLTPALCAVLLEVHPLTDKGILGLFNRFIDKLSYGYGGTVTFLSKRLSLTLVIFIALLVYIGFLAKNLPGGFLPPEDKGSFIVDVTLPEASTLDRTINEVDKITLELEALPGVKRVLAANGFSLLKGALSTNSAMLIVSLDNWDIRTTPDKSIDTILVKARMVLANNKEVKGLALTTPPIPGLGTTSGLTLMLEDIQGRSTESLEPVYKQFSQALMARDEIAFAFSTFSANVPQLKLNIDYEQAVKLGVKPSDINATISTMFGKKYINDFTKFGKNYQVNMMSEASFRNEETDLRTLFVKSMKGEMVAFDAFADFEANVGSDVSGRYNLYNALQILAAPAAGYSTGDAIKAVNEVSKSLPDGYKFEWTGQTYQEVKTAGGAVALFLLAILFTYLFLVAQYESWLTPFAIILCVPTALLGSLLLVSLMGGTLNLYVQIGLVLMIGMACRNAILIVEFAKSLREDEGMSILDSAVTAAKMRMRAVLMTAFSFILGVIPLVMATGAGSASRNTMGHAVFGGMFSATIIGCIFAPVFFVMFQKLRERFNKPKTPSE